MLRKSCAFSSKITRKCGKMPRWLCGALRCGTRQCVAGRVELAARVPNLHETTEPRRSRRRPRPALGLYRLPRGRAPGIAGRDGHQGDGLGSRWRRWGRRSPPSLHHDAQLAQSAHYRPVDDWQPIHAVEPPAQRRQRAGRPVGHVVLLGCRELQTAGSAHAEALCGATAMVAVRSVPSTDTTVTWTRARPCASSSRSSSSWISPSPSQTWRFRRGLFAFAHIMVIRLPLRATVSSHARQRNRIDAR